MAELRHLVLVLGDQLNRDSAAFAPLAMVIDPAFTWGNDRPPRTPWHKTIIYELHVRDFSANDASVPADYRGTFKAFTVNNSNGIRHLAGLAASIYAIGYLKAFHGRVSVAALAALTNAFLLSMTRNRSIFSTVTASCVRRASNG